MAPENNKSRFSMKTAIAVVVLVASVLGAGLALNYTFDALQASQISAQDSKIALKVDRPDFLILAAEVGKKAASSTVTELKADMQREFEQLRAISNKNTELLWQIIQNQRDGQ